jgi:F-type H+-transporting ATPase subunit a
MLTQFASLNEMHISIAAEKLFTIGSFPVTNGMLTGIVGALITVAILFYVAGKVKRGQYNRFVGLVQWVFEGLLHQIDDIIPKKELARKITPLAVTMFFVVLINYWFSVLPGLDSIKWHGVPVIRSLTADLNFTLGLALITVVTVQMYAIRYLGVFGNAGRYLRSPFKDPVAAMEGILELIGEFSRGVALALRLFGNAFAGEVLLVVIAILSSYLAGFVLPFFMAFELFIGFVQAYVFFVLTLIFTSLAVSHDHDNDPNATSIDHSPVPKKKAAQLE